MAVKMEVWGNFACFSRPEMKVERVSYDVMTPSAARGMLEAVYWHPGLQWHIDNIYVLAPIQMTNIRRNEVQSKVLGNSVRAAMTGGRTELYINTSKDIVQRASLVLQDVRYVIEAHFTLTEKAAAGDNPGKFQDIIKRRLRKGQCYHEPYVGNSRRISRSGRAERFRLFRRQGISAICCGILTSQIRQTFVRCSFVQRWKTA